MASYLKFELEDGTIVYLETIEAPKGSGGLIPASREGSAEKAALSFEKSFNSVRKMAATMLKDLREGFTQEPEEVSITFGLKASAELGNLIVARGGMDANYGVTLRWRNEKKEPEKNDSGKNVQSE